MKKIFTMMMILGLALMAFSQVQVTFNLDMTYTDFDEASEDLYYSGDFNDWATPGVDAAAKFAENVDGTFTVVFFDVMPGYTWNDFYRENEFGTGWGTNGEWPGAPTGIDAMVYVADEDIVFNSVWGEVFFMDLSVDMNGEAGFNPASDSVFATNDGYVDEFEFIHMTDPDADGIYSASWDSIPQMHLPIIFAYVTTDTDTIYEWSPVDSLGTRILIVEDFDIDDTYIFGNKSGVGVHEQETVQVSMFPNPSTGIYHVELDGVYNVMVMDITGKLIHREVIEYNGMFDLSDHPTGMYIVRFTSGQKVATQKILLK
jgi:hypothetical protein